MNALFRSAWLAIIGLVYVAFASLEANPRSIGAWTVLVGGPVALLWVWRRTGAETTPHEYGEPGARAAARAAVFGTLLWLGARTGPAGQPGFDAAANLGTAIAVVAGLIALARFAPVAGMKVGGGTSRSLDAAAFSAVIWSIPTSLATIRALVRTSLLVIDPLTIDYATTTAGIASTLLGIAATGRVTYQRRLELGTSERARASLIVAVAAGLSSLAATLLDLAAPDRALPVSLLATALFCVVAALVRNAGRLSAAIRAALAILVIGAPLTLLLALMAEFAPSRAPWFVIAAGAVCVTLGLMARELARPLAKDQVRRLDAIRSASNAALTPHPEDALAAALEALLPTGAGGTTRVELWRLEPATVIYVDLAGHLYEESCSIPDCVVKLCEDEPEGTLRRETLEAAQVRHTVARQALGYFDTRRTASATLMTTSDGPIGLIALPATYHRSHLSMEEAQALRQLADRLAAVVAITAASARAREREVAAAARTAELGLECARLANRWHTEGLRQRFLTEHLAHPVRAALFSPAAIMAREKVHEIALQDLSAALLAEPGVDAIGWAALLHQQSPRSIGPFVVFDATCHHLGEGEHDTTLASLRSAAEGGTLVLVHPAGLTLEQQTELAHSLTRNTEAESDALGAALSEALGGRVQVVGAPRATACIVICREHPDVLLAQKTLAEPLARRIAERVVRLPTLAERPEDVRGTILDRVARLGLSLRGEPFGVEMPVLRELLEYSWPCNELELSTVLTSLIAFAERSPATLVDLSKTSFPLDRPLAVPAETPPVPAIRQRTRSRRPRGED